MKLPPDNLTVPASSARPHNSWVPRPLAAFRRVQQGVQGEQRWERRHPTPPQIETGVSRGYRRYRGTLNGQLLTVEFMTDEAPDSLDGMSRTGRYYFDRGGSPHSLRVLRHSGRASQLRLLEMESSEDDTTAQVAHWLARQPVGPVLTGQRIDRRTGQRQPFTLREDYAGAVRYEVISEEIKGDTLWRDFGDGEVVHRYTHIGRQVVHLLGPDTLQPGLRRLQCQTSRKRQTELRNEFDYSRSDRQIIGVNAYVTIEYNGSNLLAIHTFDRNDLGPGAGGDDVKIYDLTTGHSHTIAEWLQPDKYRQFCQLLRQLAQKDHGELNPLEKPVRLPELGLNADGVYCTLGAMSPVAQVVAGKLLTIPFAQLAPYVRPGTPLARLVAERCGQR